MNNKITVGIVCGGKSVEHEISLISAKSIIKNIDRKKFNIQIIGIDKRGNWLYYNNENFLINENDPKKIKLKKEGIPVCFIPGHRRVKIAAAGKRNIKVKSPDVFFPVLHGPHGEDGTIQGLFETLNIPYVGAGVMSSAICMDKDVTKRLLRSAGIPVTNFLSINKQYYKELKKKILKFIKNAFFTPIFVKPANIGSSVGISMVTHKKNIEQAINTAFRFDNKILIEQGILGREIECSVLGNDKPTASLLGEIVPKDRFYSYKAKYLDKEGARLIAPAKLSKKLIKKIQKLAVSAYKILCCEGMARVDLFVDEKRKRVIVNELNTIPGFTPISMYPKLWTLSKIPYDKLIERLILLAIQRFKTKSRLKITL